MLQKSKKDLKINDESEDVENNNEEDNENLYFIEKEGYNEYIFFLDIGLEEEKDFRKFYITCENAKKEDIIKIIVNSSGGKLGVFSQIFNSLINTKAKTISEIYVAHSAASYVALSCDEIRPMRFAHMVIHSGSTELSGQVGILKCQTDFFIYQNNSILYELTEGFLTKEEMKKIEEGFEMWLNEDEIKKRLKIWTPIRRRIK